MEARMAEPRLQQLYQGGSLHSKNNFKRGLVCINIPGALDRIPLWLELTF